MPRDTPATPPRHHSLLVVFSSSRRAPIMWHRTASVRSVLRRCRRERRHWFIFGVDASRRGQVAFECFLSSSVQRFLAGTREATMPARSIQSTPHTNALSKACVHENSVEPCSPLFILVHATVRGGMTAIAGLQQPKLTCSQPVSLNFLLGACSHRGLCSTACCHPLQLPASDIMDDCICVVYLWWHCFACPGLESQCTLPQPRYNILRIISLQKDLCCY